MKFRLVVSEILLVKVWSNYIVVVIPKSKSTIQIDNGICVT